jgi:hypothetical protein
MWKQQARGQVCAEAWFWRGGRFVRHQKLPAKIVGVVVVVATGQRTTQTSFC